MAVSVDRLVYSKPHCEVCPIFLGQPVPVVRTDAGYALFCEVCALGHGASGLYTIRGRSVTVTVDDAGDAAPSSEEE